MPTSFEALALLLLFAIPAYLTIAVHKARYPIQYYQEKQTPIEQAALYVFLGTAVNFLSAFFLWLSWLLAGCLRSLFGARVTLLLQELNNSPDRLFIVAFLLVFAYVITSTALSFLIGDIFGRLLPVEEPLWVTELKKLRVIQTKADVKAIWVLVYLKNGDRCLGLVESFKWTGGEENAVEMVMEEAVYQSAKGERQPPGRVLMRSGDIMCLSAYPDLS